MQLISAFAVAVPRLCHDVQSHVHAGELSAAAALAHRLKGSAGGYGFEPVRDVAAALEHEARAGDAATCETLAAHLVALGSRVRAGAPDRGEDHR
jgi:HPt (histidine-containing phosphotransfer) domain-containing protein